MKSTLLTVLLANAALAIPANAAWQRLGGLDKRPIDVSDANELGKGGLEASAGIGQPENLISYDATLAAKLPLGASNVVLNLDKQLPVNSVTLVNDGIEGRVSVSTSPDKSTWTDVARSVFTSADRSIGTHFASAQAKYVRISFDLTKAGTARALSVYGEEFDKTDTRIIYINPSPMRGDDLATKYGRFEFPETNDKFRTVVYDLGNPRLLTEFNSTHSPRPVRFSVYAFEGELPEKEDWRGQMSLDSAVLDGMKPLATAEDARGVGFIKLKVQAPVTARYVALRWEPDFNPPAFVVECVGLPKPEAPKTKENGGGGAGGAGGGGSDSDKPKSTENNQGSNQAGSSGFSFSTGGFGGGVGLPSGGRNENAIGENNNNLGRRRPVSRR
jgi:hypothetical protein